MPYTEDLETFERLCRVPTEAETIAGDGLLRTATPRYPGCRTERVAAGGVPYTAVACIECRRRLWLVPRPSPIALVTTTPYSRDYAPANHARYACPCGNLFLFKWVQLDPQRYLAGGQAAG